MELQGRLWKNEYNIGEKKIDAQHYQLFYKIERLIYIAKNKELKEVRKECDDIIEFLISYTIEHFETEEKYQRKINYVSYDQHKKIHDNFRNTVIRYKEQLDNNFSSKVLKDFIGTLLTWLIVHVSNCDKKIVHNESLTPNITFNNGEDIIKAVVKKILSKTYDIPINTINTLVYKGYIDGDVFIKSEVNGEKKHMFIYGFSKELVYNLYNKMTSITIHNLDEIDEMASSAIKEVGNILSSYTLGIMVNDNLSNYIFREKVYLEKYDEDNHNIRNSVIVEFETGYGVLEVLYMIK